MPDVLELYCVTRVSRIVGAHGRRVLYDQWLCSGIIAGIWLNARGQSRAMGRADERCEAVQWAVLMSGGTCVANALCVCVMNRWTG